MWSVDPQAYETHKKSERKGDNKKHKNVRKLKKVYNIKSLKTVCHRLYFIQILIIIKPHLFFYDFGGGPIYLFSFVGVYSILFGLIQVNQQACLGWCWAVQL